MAHLVLNCDGVDLVTDKLGNVTTIGRAPSNHIVIDNPAVSAQHAIIGRSADSYRLKDLDSTNGTQVNGVFITDVELKDGDMPNKIALDICRIKISGWKRAKAANAMPPS